MPQVIAVALVGAGLYAGCRWLMRAAQQIAAEIKRAEDEFQQRASGGTLAKDMGELEYDPASRVYRPKQH